MGGGGGGEDGDFGFQIAPMVDVVFVLLLFFMACAGQNITEGFMKVALPSGGESSSTTKVPIVIDIDATGNVSVNREPKGGGKGDHELKELTDYLMGSMQSDPEDPVVIRPSQDALHERVIDVLNSCRTARVKNLSFS
jgi:biopolymer transport protein ExbD